MSLLVLSPASIFPLTANCEGLVEDNSVKTVSEQLHLHVTAPQNPLKVLKSLLPRPDFCLFPPYVLLFFTFLGPVQ